MGGMMCCVSSEGSAAVKEGTVNFMSPTDLKALLDAPSITNPVCVLDCEVDADSAKAEATYKAHRVPGSHYFNLGKFVDINAKTYKIPGEEVMAEILKATGYGPDSTFVLYDHKDGKFALHAAHVMSLHGIKKTYVLAGKFEVAWPAPEAPVEFKAPEKGKDTVFAVKKKTTLNASYEDVLKATKNQDCVILDCRPMLQFKKGSIDNAVSFPAGKCWDNHMYLKQEQVAQALKDANVEASKKHIIVYGNGNYAVVKAVLDFHGVSPHPIVVFEGGYAEWSDRKAKT